MPVVLGPQLGLHCGHRLRAQAAGRPMARKRWGSFRESLALEQWVRFVGKDVSRTKGSEGGHRQRKPGGRGFW